MNFIIREATNSDIAPMTDLAQAKRDEYSKWEPNYWQSADGAKEIHAKYFSSLIKDNKTILYVAESNSIVIGFIIGIMVEVPPVYKSGKPVLIDDFCINSEFKYEDVGLSLLKSVEEKAKSVSNSAISIVVCAAKDKMKKDFLEEKCFTNACEWHFRDLI